MNEAKRGGAEVAEEDAEKDDRNLLVCALVVSAASSLRSLLLRVSIDLHCRMTGSSLVISGDCNLVARCCKDFGHSRTRDGDQPTEMDTSGLHWPTW
jgi:hypothetical protein